MIPNIGTTFCSDCGYWVTLSHPCSRFQREDKGLPRCETCKGRRGQHWSPPHMSRAVIVATVEDAAEVLRAGGAFILRPDEPKPPA
jgi:hypothetical protein